MDSDINLSTIALHAGQEPDPTTGALAVPIYQTTSYSFKDADHAAALFGLKESGNIYTRLMNPTTDVLEKRVAAIEGGTAGVATASGLAAISLALLTLTSPGDEIVAADNLYGGTHSLLRYTFENLGRKVIFVDSQNPQAFDDAITDKTRAVYAESLGNPKLDVPDFEKIAKISHAAKVPFVVDNTTAVGLIRPIDYGADIVVHSATKYIGGHGTTLGGTIVDSGKFNWDNGKFNQFTEPDPSYHGFVFNDGFRDVKGVGNMVFAARVRLVTLRDLGATLSPFNAFQLLMGLETLSLRITRHSENAAAVAEFLKGHKKVSWVNYPGLASHPSHKTAEKYMKRGYGGMLGFGVKGGLEEGKKVINSLKLFSHVANIGDSKSLIIHPASTTHQQLSAADQLAAGVTPEFIRASIGTEDVEDIIQDLKQALDAI